MAVRVRRRRVVAVALLALLLVVGSALWRARGDDAEAGPPPAHQPSATASAAAGSSSAATPTAGTVVQRGDGTLAVVAGKAAAPGRGKVLTVRVEVEGHAGLEEGSFADAVMDALNDPRSWGHGGVRTFARTDGPADVRVILASPQTSAQLCRPLATLGRVSCSVENRAILTSYRWAVGTPEFPDLTVYRQYVVNHEVGHVLGHGHERCPGPGRPAPVMQQQTIGVAPCTPNAWPFT